MQQCQREGFGIDEDENESEGERVGERKDESENENAQEIVSACKLVKSLLVVEEWICTYLLSLLLLLLLLSALLLNIAKYLHYKAAC